MKLNTGARPLPTNLHDKIASLQELKRQGRMSELTYLDQYAKLFSRIDCLLIFDD